MFHGRSWACLLGSGAQLTRHIDTRGVLKKPMTCVQPPLDHNFAKGLRGPCSGVLAAQGYHRVLSLAAGPARAWSVPGAAQVLQIH